MLNKRYNEATVIVGAGITGLTAAYFLSKGGQQCLLLEKEEAIGGLCRSFEMDDIIFDLGPHLFFHNPDFEAERFMMELLKGEDIIKRRFRFAISTDGKYWRFPLNLFDLMLYPWEYQKQFLSNFLRKNINLSNSDKSLEQDINKKGGPFYYEHIFAPMILKKTLLSGKRIHSDWVARVDRDVHNRREPFREISHGRLFKKILSSFYQTYYYPQEGFRKFSEKLMEKYRQTGGEIMLNCGPLKFEKRDNTLTGIIIKGRPFSLRNVIWTGPINSLNELLGNNVQSLRSVKTIIVLLTYNQKGLVYRPFVYVYYPHKDLIFNRIYYPASIYRNKSPLGKEGVCLELNYRDELDNMTDETIINRAVQDVETQGLFSSAALRHSRVVRLGECLPVYDLDYEAQMENVFSVLRSYNNLYSVGRQGGYFFCMTPPAVAQGMKVARHILQNS
jgi:protoporphyrinogen oxidase